VRVANELQSASGCHRRMRWRKVKAAEMAEMVTRGGGRTRDSGGQEGDERVMLRCRSETEAREAW
jgi:hypothetical protein